jgi:hypothetical protein
MGKYETRMTMWDGEDICDNDRFRNDDDYIACDFFNESFELSDRRTFEMKEVNHFLNLDKQIN